MMHGLTDGAAAVSAGWVCQLKFEENTDNTMVQTLLGRGDLDFSLAEVRTSHSATTAALGTRRQLLCLYRAGQICTRWASGKERKSKTGLQANQVSWLAAVS